MPPTVANLLVITYVIISGMYGLFYGKRSIGANGPRLGEQLLNEIANEQLRRLL